MLLIKIGLIGKRGTIRWHKKTCERIPNHNYDPKEPPGSVTLFSKSSTNDYEKRITRLISSTTDYINQSERQSYEECENLYVRGL